MFDLTTGGGCRCGRSCTVRCVDPAIVPWDSLAMDCFDMRNIYFRRACPYTLPLTAPLGDYGVGDTIPFYQPHGVGPPLTGAGDYQIRFDRRRSPSLGSNDENSDNEEPFETLQRRFEDFETGLRTETFPQGGWGLSFPMWLSVSTADEFGDRWLFYADSEGVQFQSIVSIYKCNLTTGQTYTHRMTNFAYFAEVQFDTGSGVNTISAGMFDQWGEEYNYRLPTCIAIGKDRMAFVGRRQRSWVITRELRYPADASSWITSLDIKFQAQNHLTSRSIVEYFREDPRYFLEKQGNNVYAGSDIDGERKSELIWTNNTGDADNDWLPYGYQRRGDRHTFLIGDYNPIYDEDGTKQWEAVRVVDIECGNVKVTPIPGSHAVFVGPDGELIVAGTSHVSRVGTGSWTIDLDNAAGESITMTREPGGWLHVKGARLAVDAAIDLRRTKFTSGISGMIPSEDVPETIVTSFSVHPKGPSYGMTPHLQLGRARTASFGYDRLKTEFIGRGFQGAGPFVQATIDDIDYFDPRHDGNLGPFSRRIGVAPLGCAGWGSPAGWGVS